jgi:hypothetical protein
VSHDPAAVVPVPIFIIIGDEDVPPKNVPVDTSATLELRGVRSPELTFLSPDGILVILLIGCFCLKAARVGVRPNGFFAE